MILEDGTDWLSPNGMKLPLYTA